MENSEGQNMHRDIIQIRILALSYFIFASGIAYFASLPIPFLAFWNLIFWPAIKSGEPIQTHPTPISLLAVVGLFVTSIVVPITILVLGCLLTFNFAKLGYLLLKKEKYQFCQKMVGISILLVPIGTVLGLLMHSVLLRPSVKELFNYSDIAAKT